MKKFGTFLILLSVVLFIFCGVFAGKANDKYTNYVRADDGVTLNHNAYVNGDGYNFIINGTHFTAFAVYAAAAGLGGLIALIGGGFLICLHSKMDIIALQAARSALDVARDNGAPKQ